MAQWEREATAERTSAALQVLKQQGRATGGVAPYGFQFIDGRRAWHQGEQETHAAIIEHRAAGLSWAKVADKLSATGHRTRTGGQWTRQGAHQVHLARERDDLAPQRKRRQARRGTSRGQETTTAPPSGGRPCPIRSIIAKRAAAAARGRARVGALAPGRLRVRAGAATF